MAVGTSVAEVVQPDKLKAALKIAETQARDIQIGQPAEVDTHNGVDSRARHANRSGGIERNAHR